MLDVVNLSERLNGIDQYWQPRVVGAVNDHHVKVVRFAGSFLWHHHEAEDEMFLVLRGTMHMHYRENGREATAVVGPGEFVIVPKKLEHMPVADGEVEVLLFEPATTLNTGNVVNERTYVDPAVAR